MTIGSVRFESILGSDILSVGGQTLAIAWSPDSRYLAALGNQFHVRVFDAHSGRLVADHGDSFNINHLVSVVDGENLIVGDHRALWRISSGKPIEQIFAFEPYTGSPGWCVEHIVGCLDGSVAALYEASGFGTIGRVLRIRIIDLVRGTIRANLPIDANIIQSSKSLFRMFRKKPDIVLNGMAMTPDGTALYGLIAVIGASRADSLSGIIAGWNCQDGTPIRTVAVPEEIYFCGTSRSFSDDLSVSADGTKLSTRSYTFQLQPNLTWKRRDQDLGGLAPRPFLSGDRHVVAGSKGVAVISDYPEQSGSSHPSNEDWFVLGTSVSPNEKYVVVGNDTRLLQFSLPDLAPLHASSGHVRQVKEMVASEHGASLVSCDDAKTFSWDVESGRILAKQIIRSSWGMTLSPDQRSIMIAGGVVHFLSVASLAVTQDTSIRATAVAWPEMAQPIAITDLGGGKGKTLLHIYSGYPLAAVGAFPIPKPRCQPFLSRDGRILLMSNDNITFACDLNKKKVLWKKPFVSIPVAISGDSSTIVLDSREKHGLIAVDSESGLVIGSIPIERLEHRIGHPILSFAHSRLRLAIAAGDHCVRIVDVERTGDRIETTSVEVCTQHKPNITCVAWSGDGTKLFTGGVDGRISCFAISES
jgi:WD40 repeat protein